MQKPTDVTTALQMEKEALEQMKKSRYVKKYSGLKNFSGITNPNSVFEDVKVQEAQRLPTEKTSPCSSSDAPDLMSFQEVSSHMQSEWNTFETSSLVSCSNATAYNHSINDVLSLYNAPTTVSSLERASHTQQRSYSPNFDYSRVADMSRRQTVAYSPMSAVLNSDQGFGNYFSQARSLYPQPHSFHNIYSNPYSNNISSMAQFTRKAALTLPAHFKGDENKNNSSSSQEENIQQGRPNFFDSNFATTGDKKFEKDLSPLTPALPRPSSMGLLHTNTSDKPMFHVLPTAALNVTSSSYFQSNIQNQHENTDGFHRSSSAGSDIQGLATDQLQNDRLTSIFNEWLNDSWTTDTDAVISSPSVEVKATPDWLEWDPLNAPSEDPSSVQSLKSTNQVAPALSSPQQGSFKGEEFESMKSKVPAQKALTPSQNEKTARPVQMEVDESTELQRFAQMLVQLRSGFKHIDHLSNPGHVISLMKGGCHLTEHGTHGGTDSQHYYEQDATVRISVTTDGIVQPVTFECDVNASVEHIVSQALCIAYEDITLVSSDDYLFKVIGRQEYLISKSRLSLYQYVQECRKFEQDVKLELLHKSKLDLSLQRTAGDDEKGTIDKDFLNLLDAPTGIVSRDKIQYLLDSFYKEVEKFLEEIKLDSENSSLFAQQQLERVIQCVKAACCTLGNIEPLDVTEAVKKLRSTLIRPPNSPATKRKIVDNLIAVTDYDVTESVSSSARFQRIREAVENLTSVVLDLSEMYCKAFEVDAYCHAVSCNTVGLSTVQIASTDVKELYSVNVICAHRLPKQWETSYDEFFASCCLFHGEKPLSSSNSSTNQSKLIKGFSSKVIWNKWLEFDVGVCGLPLEVTLRIILYGTIASEERVISKRLAFINIPLFDQNKILKQRSEIYGMWNFSKVATKPDDVRCPMSCSNNIHSQDSVMLHIAFSEDKTPSISVKHFQNLAAKTDRHVVWQSISTLEEKEQKNLKEALSRARLMAGPLCNLSQRERNILWKNRLIIASPDVDNEYTLRLPLLLQCVPQWSPCLEHPQAAYDLLSSCSQRLEPEESLALLTPGFPDVRVRSAAIRWIEMAGDMEITSWLPQLVQAMRCEQHHDNPLSRLLLRRALGSIRICHKLYWLLHENMSDKLHGKRFSFLHAALLTLCGSAMKKEFEKEVYSLKMIHRVAETVKEVKDSMKSTALNDDLAKISSRIGGGKFRIPTNPALVANGLNVKNSSYFTSNAFPIKLAFSNADSPDNDICIMYKVGDDLRQDALTMQLIRVMDRMWLSAGLDLRIVTFDCLPTGHNQGMVELISDSKTFREIQSSYGLTGAFKDRPIAEWLQKYNPTGLSYERAVENFTLSCAGYCVATYVLGICDRHNDNIMLRNTGHLFHIDFARFLGHAQMFGNIKRDRAPFVLTSDMAYVINGGDRPSSRFQDFVDVCCQAFNILRKESHTIINLLSLMVDCGIPELSSKSDLKYVYDTLKPNASDTEATTMFTRLIDASLSSSFTRLNFFIHNLAQMRFHGNESEEGRKVLSFSPQIHGFKEEEGIIIMATVVGYQKRYSPEKYYMYCVKVTRERSTTSIESYVFRTFDEFEELNRKLSYNTTLMLPSFPNLVVVGRSQVKQVAERRKAKLNTYLTALLKSPPKVAAHDLVYTFFHPILRDDEQDFKSNPKSPDLTVGGEIKLSIHYKNNAFYVMVNHCKNLSPVNGTDPDPYVKTYLLPDPTRSTKRKTKVARKTLHPTYNEMLVYNLSLGDVKSRKLHISVWNYENLQENDFMGNTVIDLSSVDVTTETIAWYRLQSSSLQ